ncbi:MAG: hypothetical protein NTZ05_17805 [Chloroflexi bacterium]|nr:hypothetical protein [Chloroflexota bacterium]
MAPQVTIGPRQLPAAFKVSNDPSEAAEVRLTNIDPPYAYAAVAQRGSGARLRGERGCLVRQEGGDGQAQREVAMLPGVAYYVLPAAAPAVTNGDAFTTYDQNAPLGTDGLTTFWIRLVTQGPTVSPYPDADAGNDTLPF